MSRPKIMVFKLKDLQIPIIMLLVALAVFTFFIFSNKSVTETFSPSDDYQDGQYLANVALADADFDLVVDVVDHKISAVSVSNFDDTEKVVYEDLNANVAFINDYVTSTQSLELPATDQISTSTTLLMNAVKVALSDDKDAAFTTTYQAPLLEQISSESTSSMVTEEAANKEEGTDVSLVEEDTSQVDEDTSNVEETTSQAKEDSSQVDGDSSQVEVSKED